VCLTIPTYNSVFLFVFDDSFVRTKDSPKDPIRKSEDTKIRVFVLPLFPRYFITVHNLCIFMHDLFAIRVFFVLLVRTMFL
jgi:hypothetical protein